MSGGLKQDRVARRQRMKRGWEVRWIVGVAGRWVFLRFRLRERCMVAVR
jgi:hypothetical protein